MKNEKKLCLFVDEKKLPVVFLRIDISITAFLCAKKNLRKILRFVIWQQ